MENTEVVAKLIPSIVLDDNRTRDAKGKLRLDSVKVDGKRVATEDGVDVRTRISKSGWTQIEAESERFDRDLYALLELRLEVPRDAN